MALERTAYRQNMIYLVLTGFFVTNAILAEIIGVKLIEIGPFIIPMGVLPWPIVFITTDLINEYFGKRGTRRVTWMTASLIVYAFVVLFTAMQIPAWSGSPVDDATFSKVFGQSLWIITGSITAFLISQMIDVTVFWKFRDLTGGKKLWLRATGSTFISQLIDTFIVQGIAFWLPGVLSTEDFLRGAFTSYGYKIVVAVAITPIIYAAHHLIDNYLGERAADDLVEEAVAEHRQELAAKD